EVVHQQGAGDAHDARIVQQRTEPLVLVDKGHDAGARRAVVRLARVPAAALAPDRLEGRGDGPDVGGKQARERQEAERLEERDLLLWKLHTLPLLLSRSPGGRARAS